jgi:hypothetical protein
MRRAATVALLALTACYSFPTMGRARTLGRGRVEVWAAPEALIVATPGARCNKPARASGHWSKVACVTA